MQGQNNYFWHEWLNCFIPAAAEQAEQENNACSSVVGDAPIKIWVIGVYCSFACESKVFPFHVWYHFKCLSAIGKMVLISLQLLEIGERLRT